MTRTKISFLFFLGICLVVIAVFRGHDSNSHIDSNKSHGQYLTWNGTHVIVINNKYKAEQLNKKIVLPPELCPIFFHPIPLNFAEQELLVTLPGVGPVTAELIVRKRLEYGRIINREQLISIKGIGQKTAELIEQYTTYDQ